MWNADLGNGRYKNPVLYADYSDPDAIRVGEDYYMIASSFCNAPALPILHSKDLVNWKVINYVLDKVPEFRYRNPIHGCGVWAPSIRYHEGIFYACFPMPDEGIYMATTRDPWGKWSEPVNIRPKAGWIDPCPFWDEDGKAYLVAGVAKSRIGYKSVLHMVEMQPDGMGLIGKEVRIYDGSLDGNVTTEGPKMYKRNGWYYIFAPAGGVKTGWQLVLRSRSVFGPYETRVVMRQGNSPVNGPHQGAWVDTVTGQDWFLHFQDVYAAGRITHLQPMHWENDWPVIGESKPGETCGTPVLEYQKPDVGNGGADGLPVCEPDTSDDFTGQKLGLQWQWNANPEENWATPDSAAACLHLRAVPACHLRPVSDYRNLLLQKWPAPEFCCITKMRVDQLEEGDRAGIVSLGTRYGALAVEKNKEGLQLFQIRGEQIFDCDVPYTAQEEKPVCLIPAQKAGSYRNLWFRYEVRCLRKEDRREGSFVIPQVPSEEITMSCSLDGKIYQYAFSIPAVAGRWVGVKNGVFCVHEQSLPGGGEIALEKVTYQTL